MLRVRSGSGLALSTPRRCAARPRTISRLHLGTRYAGGRTARPPSPSRLCVHHGAAVPDRAGEHRVRPGSGLPPPRGLARPRSRADPQGVGLECSEARQHRPRSARPVRPPRDDDGDHGNYGIGVVGRRDFCAGCWERRRAARVCSGGCWRLPLVVSSTGVGGWGGRASRPRGWCGSAAVVDGASARRATTSTLGASTWMECRGPYRPHRGC